MRFAFGIEPTLDDLHAVEVCAINVSQRADQESWSFTFRCSGEVAAHRHSFLVTVFGKVVPLRVIRDEIPAGENAHDQPCAGGGIDFLARHGIPQCLAGVVRRPNRGNAGGARLPGILPL